MKGKRFFAAMLCLVLLIPVLAMYASADCGPKPSTVVRVNSLGKTEYVLTLLAKDYGNGPHSTVEKEDSCPETEEIRAEAWTAFRDYQDPDGFHFWGETYIPMVNWNYYPPEVFKIAIYYPEYDTLQISDQIFERYAFHSDYTLWLTDADPTVSGVVSMRVDTDFSWGAEIGGFLLRVVLTLVVELAVALLFGYRSKGQIKTILAVNLVTQVILNVLLTLWYLLDGPLNAMLRLLLAEILVLILEAFLYARRLPGENGKKRKAVLYAAAANILSVIVGWLLIN